MIKFQVSASPFLVLLFVFYVFATQVFAAGAGRDDRQFQIDVWLDTKVEEINAVDGMVAYPPDWSRPKSILIGDSVISLWVTVPKADKPGEISFSGVIPGGYVGTGKLFTVVFANKGSADGVSLKNYRILLNDGNGSAAQKAELKLAASKLANEDFVPAAEDIQPPEAFTPEIASDPNVFDGKYFLVFVAQDKGGGVSHYEVMEVPSGKGQAASEWAPADSPYLLKDQNLSSDVYVRAVDLAGNFTIVKVPARSPVSENAEIIKTVVTVIAMLIVLLFIIWVLARRFSY